VRCSVCVCVHVDFPVVFSLPEMVNKVKYNVKDDCEAMNLNLVETVCSNRPHLAVATMRPNTMIVVSRR